MNFNNLPKERWFRRLDIYIDMCNIIDRGWHSAI